MATKKDSTPVLNVPENEDAKLEAEANKLQQMANMQAELEALKRENEKLRANSIAAMGANGSRTDYERVKDACKKAAEEHKDPWTIKISVRAPRRPLKEEPYYWLSVNDHQVQIPADDKYYDLALPFADDLVEMIAAEWRAADFSDSIENYDPVTNPKKE